MPFLSALLATAARQPEAIAIVHGDAEITYGELQRRWLALAAILQARGVGHGQRVGLTFPQSPDYCIATLALAHLGAVALNLSPTLPAVGRRELCARFGVEVLLSYWKDVDTASLPLICYGDVLSEAPMQVPLPEPAADWPFRILLTSGTTDLPAGVIQTHEAATLRMTRMSAPFESGTCLLASDLNVASSLIPVLGTLCAGGKVVFATDYHAEDVIGAMQRNAVTRLMMVPVQAAGLAHFVAGCQVSLPALKHVCLVGATPAPPVTALLRARLTPHVHVVYGVTEIGVIALATAEALAARPGSVGRVAPWARIEIVDEAGSPLAARGIGIVRVAVEGMIGDYVGAATERSSRFAGGWFYPGDLGWLDEEGYLYIEGRQDELLNVGGNKVKPEAIESVLRGFPGVQDVAVFLDRTSTGDHQLVAAVVSQQPIDVNRIAPFAAQHLGWLAPNCYMRMESLPRTESGKLQRRLLQGSLVKHGM